MRARWPGSNFTDVARHALQNPGRDEVDVLVLAAPTVDISNLDTSKLKPTDKTEALQHKVTLSCQNMFFLAENSLRNSPKLAKVVILEHPPRFDTPNVDPTSLKPDLARLANSTFGQLWLNSPLKDKICIGHHSLESSGVGTAHIARYQDSRTGRYDGVHFYGERAGLDFTNSLKTILMLAVAELNSIRRPNEVGTAQSDEQTHFPQARDEMKKCHPSVPTRNRFNMFNQGNC